MKTITYILGLALLTVSPLIAAPDTPKNLYRKTITLHQKDQVSTNHDHSATLNPKAAADMSLGRGWKVTTPRIGEPGHKVQEVLAQKDSKRPLVVFCGGQNYEPTYNGGSVLRAMAGFGNVLSFDYPGMGTSDGSGSAQDYQRLIHSLSADIARRQMRSNSRLLFIGHGLGSAICARIAGRTAYPSTLVLDGIRTSLRNHPYVSPGRGIHIAYAADFMSTSIYRAVLPFQGDLFWLTYPKYQKWSAQLRKKYQNLILRLHITDVDSGKTSWPLLTPLNLLMQRTEYLEKLRVALATQGFTYIPLTQARYRPEWHVFCPATKGRKCLHLQWPDGTWFSGQLENSALNGPSVTHFADGSILQASYQSDRLTGHFTYIRANGRTRTGIVPQWHEEMLAGGKLVRSPEPLVTATEGKLWYGVEVTREGKPAGITAVSLTGIDPEDVAALSLRRPDDYLTDRKHNSRHPGIGIPHIRFFTEFHP